MSVRVWFAWKSQTLMQTVLSFEPDRGDFGSITDTLSGTNNIRYEQSPQEAAPRQRELHRYS